MLGVRTPIEREWFRVQLQTHTHTHTHTHLAARAFTSSSLETLYRLLFSFTCKDTISAKKKTLLFKKKNYFSAVPANSLSDLKKTLYSFEIVYHIQINKNNFPFFWERGIYREKQIFIRLKKVYSVENVYDIRINSCFYQHTHSALYLALPGTIFPCREIPGAIFCFCKNN